MVLIASAAARRPHVAGGCVRYARHGVLNRIFATRAEDAAMDPSQSAPVALAEPRLAWLDARQRVLSQNIAQADTPGYKPRDLPDFARVLARSTGGVGLSRTDPRHLGSGGDPRATLDRQATEVSANGNAVSLDREALKVADTDSAHALAIGMHRRWLGLFRTALGRPQ